MKNDSISFFFIHSSRLEIFKDWMAEKKHENGNNKNNKIIRCHIASILTADVSYTPPLLSQRERAKSTCWKSLCCGVSDSDWSWHQNLYYNVESFCASMGGWRVTCSLSRSLQYAHRKQKLFEITRTFTDDSETVNIWNNEISDIMSCVVNNLLNF